MQITEVKGVGPKTATLLNKLNIYTIDDLLTYYPYKYNIYKFNDVHDTLEQLIISATIESTPVVSYIKKNFNRLSFRVNASGNLFNVTIFNRAFLKPNLTVGKIVTLIGKYDAKKNQFTASDIKFNIQNGDIESVYHLTNGINNNLINKLVTNNINNDVIDLLPKKYQEEYNFISKKEAIKMIHLPNSVDDIKKAKVRLIYEELFDFSFKMNFLKKENELVNGDAKEIDDKKINLLISSLPFKLTTDQQKTVDEIIDDMKSTKKMNRLLLGDVGSGKTIISVIAIYASFISNNQSALMAPTEILAIQHYYSIKKVLDKFNVTVDLITGSMTKKEKQKIYERCQNGDIDLLTRIIKKT